jgi:hypothetical protein
VYAAEVRHDAAVVRPLTLALRASVPRMSTEEWPRSPVADVPMDYEQVGAATTVWLPPSLHLDAGTKALVRDIVCARLGLDRPTVTWHERGPMPHVSFTVRPRLPSSVTFADIRHLLARCDGSDPLIAMGAAGTEFRLAMDGTEPHTALSFATSRGKSSTLSGIIAQGVRAGWDDVTVIDPKSVSLNMLKGVPGVTIHRTWPAQWNAIIEFRQVMDERYRILNENPEATFARRVLVIEEGNSFAEEMRLYYESEIRQKGDPATPPVITDLAFTIFKGRQVHCNVIGAWQRLSVRTVGSGDVRDQFGLKVMCGHSAAAFLSLVGERGPRGPRHPGRAVIARGDTVEPAQLIYWTPAEARTWALNGRAPVPERAVTYPAASYSERAALPLVTASESGPGVTLAEAVSSGLLGCTLAAARAARARDATFPDAAGRRGREYLYAPESLARWEGRRAVLSVPAEH